MRKFGLIGFPLTHSFSQKYFTEKFEREQIDGCSYSNFPLDNIGGLTTLLADPELEGLNITIPYKEQVVPFLDWKNEVVEETGACNCIHIREGRLLGFNTDVIGFDQSLMRKWSGQRKALVLGTGGAAKAVEFVLRRRGIEYRLVSRVPDRPRGEWGYEDVKQGLLEEYTLVINTTPLGMYPKTDACPPLPYESMGPGHYLFDLVYNPARTLFLQKGEERGAVVENGYEMLVLQAEESWRVWNQ
jgi:shikimate dehydrogenase